MLLSSLSSIGRLTLVPQEYVQKLGNFGTLRNKGKQIIAYADYADDIVLIIKQRNEVKEPNEGEKMGLKINSDDNFSDIYRCT